MVGILDLPNELLVVVLAHSPTMESAVRLSGTNKRFHSIWLENEMRIVMPVLRHSIPDLDDALDLAKKETQLQLAASDDISRGGPGPSHTWLLRLLQNAELASSACASFRNCVYKRPLNSVWQNKVFTSLPAAYYIVRQVVLAYRQPEFWPTPKIEASSTESLYTYRSLAYILCEEIDDEERERHGIAKDREDWVAEDEAYANVNNDEWDYANNALDNVWRDRVEEERAL